MPRLKSYQLFHATHSHATAAHSNRATMDLTCSCLGLASVRRLSTALQGSVFVPCQVVHLTPSTEILLMPIKPEDIKAIQAFAPATGERVPATGRPSFAPHAQSGTEISGMIIKKVHGAKARKVAEDIRGALVSKPRSAVDASELRATTTPADALNGICDNLRARQPIPQNLRSGPSILGGLPDIHDLLGL